MNCEVGRTDGEACNVLRYNPVVYVY